MEETNLGTLIEKAVKDIQVQKEKEAEMDADAATDDEALEAELFDSDQNAYLKDEDFAIPKVEPVDNETLLSRLVALNTKVEKQKQAGKKCPAFPTNTKLLRDNLNNPESYPYLWYLKNRGITLQQIYKYKKGTD